MERVVRVAGGVAVTVAGGMKISHKNRAYQPRHVARGVWGV